MNNIDKIRREIRKYLDERMIIPESRNLITSPYANFQAETVEYRQVKPDVNWVVTHVKIMDLQKNEVIVDFFINDSEFCHSWIVKDTIHYLICAEDLMGGQTVIDLTNRILSGYSPDEEGFIWSNIHASPDKKMLAVVGCFWACPYAIKLYDFSSPLELPLKEIQEIELSDDPDNPVEWLDNETLLLGNSFETEGRYLCKKIKIQQERGNSLTY